MVAQLTRPADLDPELAVEIKTLSARVCQALGCSGYSRVDFRLQGRTPYVLEVNPNPCLDPQGTSFIATTEDAGFSYEATINEIMQAALSRQQRHSRLPLRLPAARQRLSQSHGANRGTRLASW
jgi:D-alanine-D-alanine ligase-like ATP-grasp enzyme